MSVKAWQQFLSLKFWAFTINGRGNSFTMKELRHKNSLKIPECVNRVAAYGSISAGKNMVKVVKKGMSQECYLGVFILYVFPTVLAFCKNEYVPIVNSSKYDY